MAKRSFSWMLAWRYLNPRRAMLSAVTIISVTGVTLGVWILVVVMSVFNGLEREVQKRLLGYTPHVRLEYAPMAGMRQPVSDWREMAEVLKKEEGVQSATAFVQDYVMLDAEGAQRPAFFRGVDTSDPAQVEGIENLLKGGYEGSSADMGLDDRVVISSQVSKQLGLGIGGKIQLYSARNLEEVKRVYDLTEQPLVKDRHRDEILKTRELLEEPMEKRGEKVYLGRERYEVLYGTVYDAVMDDEIQMRDGEMELLQEYFAVWEEDLEEVDGGYLLPGDVKEKAVAALDALDAADKDQLDAETLKGIKGLVLPKEAEVIGVYQSSQMAVMPDVFMPLHLGQELAGLGEAVQGVAVRLDDAYQADRFARQILGQLPSDWQAVTWAMEFGDFARLIHQQRVMMYIVLSMIIVISAFSMMAVMFTVTIQKRREIGVMKALGAAPGQIVGVFVYQGVILGICGALFGVALGLLLLRFRGALQDLLRRFGFDPFPADFNGFSELPAWVKSGEVLTIGLSAFALCSLAAWLPAWLAARADAAKSLRNL